MTKWSRIVLLFVCQLSLVCSFVPYKSLRPIQGLRMISEHHDTIVNLMPTVEHIHSHMEQSARHLQGMHDCSLWLADGLFAKVPEGAEEAAAASSPYAKVDNTGFIGNIASYIERAIDLGHGALNKVGVVNSYGFAICLFTVLVKAATLPLLSAQLESTSSCKALHPHRRSSKEVCRQ